MTLRPALPLGSDVVQHRRDRGRRLAAAALALLLPASLWGAAAGCAGEPADDDAASDDDTGPADDDSGPADDDSGPADDDSTTFDDGFEVEVHLSEVVPTVATVEWSAPDLSVEDAWVEYGLDTGYGLRASVDVSGPAPWSVVLLGMKASSTYHLRVGVTAGGEMVHSADRTVATGALAGELPAISVSGSDPAAGAPGFQVTSVMSSPSAAVVVDADGDVVWWYYPDVPDALVSRALPSRDGRAVLMLTHVLGSPHQQVLRVSWDGTEVLSTPVDGGHHDFLELPDGTYAAIAVDIRDVEGESVDGDRIVEYEPGGDGADVWSAWDEFVYDPDADHLDGTGWTHANALDYDDAEDAYYVSLLGLSTVLKIDRASGLSEWYLSGAASDFETASGSPQLFSFQHQFQFRDGTVLVFDNGPAGRLSSLAVEYRIDAEQGSAELLWSHEADPPLYAYSMGDVTRLGSGNTLVNYGVLGQVDEVSPDGVVVRRFGLPLGSAFGYTTYRESLHEAD